jgi:CheY-like chemotaxis protein
VGRASFFIWLLPNALDLDGKDAGPKPAATRRRERTKELSVPPKEALLETENTMGQALPPRRRRALIVEDEIVIALDLEEAMSALGFDCCDLAPSDRKARSLAMNDQPDIVLMDVCLEGGREGIETARWLREVCGASIVFVTSYSDEDTVARIHEQVPGAPVLAKPVYREILADAVTTVTKH